MPQPRYTRAKKIMKMPSDRDKQERRKDYQAGKSLGNFLMRKVGKSFEFHSKINPFSIDMLFFLFSFGMG